jgi:amino acid adenylation domain-containing protein
MRLSDFRLVDSAAEREELLARLAELNRTVRAYPREKTVDELFAAVAAACGERTAVVFEGRQWSYAELAGRANQVARYLRSVAAGVVGVLLDNSFATLAALLGIWKAGGVYLPLNPELPLDRLRLMLEETAASALLFERRYLAAANRLQWECPRLTHILAVDCADLQAAEEAAGELMSRELWDYVGAEAVDDITGGGWVSSYTGLPLSREVMDDYADNVEARLRPFLSPASRVLEIGCSSGITLFRLAPGCGFYCGVDLSPRILANTERERRRRGLEHVRLECLAAHEIDALPERDFDLVILNSVVQSFPGHGYLRRVISRAVASLGERGVLFVGDVMDPDRRDELVRSLGDWKRSHAGEGMATKTDWSHELFVPRAFWEDLRCDLPRIAGVRVCEKVASVPSELSRFRYDVLLTVDGPGEATASCRPRHRHQHGRGHLDRQPSTPLAEFGHGEDPAYILYTSGSTGRPKGVVVTHRSLHNYAQWACRTYFAELPGNMALFTSPAFDLTLTSMVCPLLGGFTVFPFRPGDPDRLLAQVFGSGLPITAVKLTPAHIAILKTLELPETAVELVIAGGEELTVDHVETLRRLAPGLRIYNEYGPTEATIGCTLARVEAPPATIGGPIDNTEVWVLDPSLELLPLGAVGELCVGGDGLAVGYLNDPRLTAAKFVDHPFRPGARLYRTGDRARWLPSGDLLLLGRVDRQVKVRGNRIELGEIEAQLRTLPAVADALVVDRDDPAGGKVLAAYVIARERTDAARLREELGRLVPDFLVPSYFVLLDRFPLSANGKLDRRALPPPEGAAGGAGAPPATAREKALAAIWREVLGVEGVGLDDNFFDRGGHSLKATQLVSRIHRSLGTRLPLSAVFKHPTLRGMSATLAQVEASLWRPIEPVADAESYEVSHAQRRLWVLHQMEDSPRAYGSLEALRLEGELDAPALAGAFRALVARHESLRTTFVREGSEPRQRVCREPRFELAEVDLRGAEDPAAAALAHGRSLAARPFDLAAGPLLRVALLRLAEREHALLLALHHIVSDGWSMGVLVREVSSFYNALTAGDEPALPPLRIQYRDFSAWQNRLVVEETEHRAYWHAKLAGELAVLDLPADFPRPAVKSFAGDHAAFRLGPETASRLARLARARGLSLFMVLVALVKGLLFRWTGEEDLLVGTPIAGRGHADLEDQIGFYVNTLVLRDRLAGGRPATALLDSVRQTTLEAYEHQIHPFDRLVEELPVARDTGRSALFDVLVVLQNTAPPEPHLAGLAVSPFPIPDPTSKFDLSFHFVEDGADVAVQLEYSTDLFGEARARRLATQLSTLAASLARDPGRRLDELDLLPPAEARQVIEEWNRTAAPEAPDVLARFAARVAEAPERPAVVGEGRSLSYRDLDRASSRLAAAIAERVRPGDLAAVFLRRSEKVLVSLLGILKAGAAYLPLDPDYPPDRIAWMLEDSGARAVVVEGSVRPPARAGSPPAIGVDGSPGEATFAAVPMPPEALAYVVYTSGSTGRPKGVAGTRRCLSSLVSWQEAVLGPGLLAAQYAALSFDVSVQEMLFAVASGGTLAVVGQELRLDPRRLLAFLGEKGVELLTLPFSALSLLFADPEAIVALPRLRHVVASGEQLVVTPEIRRVLRRRPDLALHNQYGPSETHVATSFTLAGEGAPAADLPPIGRPLPNTRAYILDGGLRPVGVGLEGELCLAGAHLAHGYLRRPELTAERFVPDPWGQGDRIYRTGDLARFGPEGEIEFRGRRDEQVKVRGFRVELGEVEHALLGHPAVAAACVAPAGEKGRAELVAYLVGADLPPAAALRSHLGRTLPEFMLPSRFVAVAALPKTPSGKVDRRALAALVAADLAPERAYVAPAGPLERTLAEIWEEVLGQGPIGREDSFFERGGHSLKAVQAIAEIERRLGIEVPLVQLFRSPTLGALAASAAEIEVRSGRPVRAPVALLNQESARQVFALPPLLGYGAAFRELAAHLPEHAVYGLDFVESEDRLEVYARALEELQPQGAYVLFGYSAGGNLAFEHARELERRGRQVSDIVLLDSFKLEAIRQVAAAEVAAEVRANLDYFGDYIASRPELAHYVEDPAVRALLVRKMEGYVRYLHGIDNAGTIGADLHLIRSEDIRDDARRVLWAGATRGKLTLHQGAGPHTDMILPAHLPANARLIRRILTALDRSR